MEHIDVKISLSNLSTKVPLDGALFRASRFLPRIDFGLQDIGIVDGSIQALVAEDAYLNLRHVELARVMGYVVELHAAHGFVGRLLAQHIVEPLSKCVERLSGTK